MIAPTQDTVAYQRLIVAICAVLVAAIGVIFGLPNLLRYLDDRRRKTRQSQVRQVLLRYGDTATGEFIVRCPLLSEFERDKALKELEEDGVIVPYEEKTGRTKWRFKIHPHSISTR